uniref:ribosomal protein L22 n=1 Tax=Goeppertia makoyana TaxID=1162975 RepID=UPI002E7A4AEC|nr:ribosomal protein L22 [Goeppertia makoyana]WRI58263.1 ribosomal protein L22 [Goeppertia makoyana]
MIKNSSSGKEVQIFAQNTYKMSLFKARRVIDQIRGRSYEETLMILELMPYRASFPILKLVYSAAANASHNMGLNEADSFISEAKVNRGLFLKRLRPRARGRSFPIRKPTCHITIVLKDKSKLFLDQSKI